MNAEGRRELYWDASRFFGCSQGRKSVVLKITAYLDESQVTENTKHVVLAGFYGEDTCWDALKRPWEETLARFGRQSLHMTELRWNSARAERRIKPLLAALGALPFKGKLTPVYGATKIKDYADLLSNGLERLAFSGYVVAFSEVLANLTIDLPANASLRVVCEEQKRYQAIARQMFHVCSKWMARSPENPWLGHFGTIPKGSSFMTEPADFLAFAIGKFMDENGSKKDLWSRPIFNGRDPHRFIRIPCREYARRGAGIVLKSSKIGKSVFQIEQFQEWLKAQGKNEASFRRLTRRFRI